MNILLVEDDKQEVETCIQSAEIFGRLNACTFRITPCRSVEEVEKKWQEHSQRLWSETGKKFFDGAIIDLKLIDNHGGGNIVASKMEELAPRMPLVIRTGTPDILANELKHIRCCRRDRDEGLFNNLFTWFLNIQKTGLTNIMEGNGEIEGKMNVVFQKVLMPQIDSWIDYAEDAVDEDARQKVEKALLRYSMNHLLGHLDQEDEEYYPEEF